MLEFQCALAGCAGKALMALRQSGFNVFLVPTCWQPFQGCGLLVAPFEPTKTVEQLRQAVLVAHLHRDRIGLLLLAERGGAN